MRRFVFIHFVLVVSLLLSSGCNQSSEWDSFDYPTLDFVAEDTVSEGAQLFYELVPNPDTLFNECILNVCQILYRHQSEVPQKTLLKFHLRNTQGVAATGGDSTTIDMFINTNYIAGFYNSHNKSKKETLEEIVGVLIHELTHAYQHSPTGAGGYAGGTEHFSCIEGVADATRLSTGCISYDFRKPGGHWNNGYKTTGFFIGWMMEKNKAFLYEFNQSTLIIKPWSWDKATHQIMGKTVAELWTEYQKEINHSGNEPVVLFDVSNDKNITDQRVVFSDHSEGNPFAWSWTFEGGMPSTSSEQNPEVIYKEPGVYTVQLTVKSAFGTATTRQQNFLSVEKNPAGKLFSELDKEVVSKYKDSPDGEGVVNLFDNSSGSKYLTFNKNTSIDLKLKTKTKYVLKKYCIVAANDAPQRDPKEVIIKGSDDGINWKILDKQRDVNFKHRFETVDFYIDNDSAYSNFRIELTNHEGNILQVADILLFGEASL